MKRPALVTTEKIQDSSILIVDKVGLIGQDLVRELPQASLVVFVSAKEPESKESLIHVPYDNKFPIIPDNFYSYIIIIDDFGRFIKESLPKFVQKAKEDRAQLIFITSDKANNNFLTALIDSYKNTKIVIYGDVFGNTTYNINEFASTINDFIYQSIKFGRIEVADNGLKKSHPVSLKDLIDCILRVIFSSNLKSNIFNIFPKHPFTDISIAHMIQAQNPNISVDFINNGAGGSGQEKENREAFPAGEYLLEENYPLADRIREINIEKLMENISEEELNYQEKKPQPSFPVMGLFLFLLASFLLPFVVTLLFYFLGFGMLNISRIAIEKNETSNAYRYAILGKNFFNIAKNSSASLITESRIIGKEELVNKLIRNINLGDDISTAMVYFFEAEKKISSILVGESKNPREDFAKATDVLKNSLVTIKKLEVEYSESEDILKKIKEIDPLVGIATNTLDVMPGILGFNDKREYLILFQNNMELRPGGGFIGSYGLLALDKGKIIEFSIHDVYDADGQLKGHVEPPYPLRRYLPSAHWYLRDSNFDVDFVKGASASALFLNLETGKKADGVIGIDISFVKNILSFIGQVYVSDYKETVNSDNLFQITQTHAEKGFFPGSTQKKDFLRSLFKAIEENVSSKKNIPYFALARSIEKGITQKHLLFAFANPGIQDIFTVNNYSGALWDNRIEEKASINDFLGVSEANLGVNKANFFIERKISQNMNIDGKGNVLGEATVFYKNNSVAWPGGDYKNYLRIILPLGSELSSISIDNSSVSQVAAITNPSIYEDKSFIPPNGLEVEKTIENNKTIYGFLTIIPAGASRTIVINYKLPKVLSLSLSNFSYDLKVFKQPGTDVYPYSFSISYPENFRLIKSTSGATSKENKASFFVDLDRDIDLTSSFGQK